MTQSVSRYAKLAKLIHNNANDSSDELDFLGKDDLNDIMQMIKSIENVDTTEVPEDFLFFSDESYRNVRLDKVTEGEIQEKVLSNTKSQNGYFVVPKVIESE
jgi:aspartyl/glutamyl-tRNA(Asn/Gln) amidotransferase C subunit